MEGLGEKLLWGGMALAGLALLGYGAREALQRIRIGVKAALQHGAAALSLAVAILLMMSGQALWSVLFGVLSLVLFGWSITDPVGFVSSVLETLRRPPRSRRDAQAPQPSPSASAPRRRAVPPPMSHEEALGILGLGQGWTRTDVQTAHRRMLMRLHPDHGGTDFLAAKVNEAKDVLLREMAEMAKSGEVSAE